ncbi:hypothetical protein US8_02474 [Bacillus altitudinis]|nr:hypothetical protein US8_02474 [Bacillus altitudinis]
MGYRFTHVFLSSYADDFQYKKEVYLFMGYTFQIVDKGLK